VTVVLLTDPAMEAHPAPSGHPERPARLAAAAAGVTDAAAGRGVDVRAEPARSATDDELTRVHPIAFIRRIEAACAAGGGWLDADTMVGPRSADAARRAAGATVDAVSAAVTGEASLAFAVVRPPGHHAARERAAGFCLFNNVAVAAEAARANGVARLAILDWDVHHGDGTQAIYDGDRDLFYASTHEWGIYPGTGAATETGIGGATGTKRNRPLAPGAGDREFVAAWVDDLLPAVVGFRPQAIVISAGYDAHADDPLARLNVTADGYRAVAEATGAAARTCGVPGVALTLEGGYDLDALRASAAATVEGLLAGLG
jgi:acetoin utilization deacetylase AcuC-like enzyme